MVVGPLGSARCQIARLCVLSGECIRNRQSASISCGGNLLNRTTNKGCHTFYGRVGVRVKMASGVLKLWPLVNPCTATVYQTL
jgi:hypothetical protein